jgi:hypothetical protein
LKIAIIHLGTPCECFIASSILRGLRKIYDHPEIYWVCQNEQSAEIFKNNPHIKRIILLKNIYPSFFEESFDKVINLSPMFLIHEYPEMKALDKIGFGFDEQTSVYARWLEGSKKIDLNIFQIYFKIAGLTWRGEGFDFYYTPRNRSNKNKTGLAIANANLRNYVIDRLKLDQSKLWIIPYKKSIFKKADEINRVKYIVTDDFFSLNISLYLRKNIFFLKTVSYNTKLEFFGQGSLFEIPDNIIK